MAAAGTTSTSAAFNGYSYSGKFGARGSTKEMELNHDFHLKMSKKIAQLTKVRAIREKYPQYRC